MRLSSTPLWPAPRFGSAVVALALATSSLPAHACDKNAAEACVPAAKPAATAHAATGCCMVPTAATAAAPQGAKSAKSAKSVKSAKSANAARAAQTCATQPAASRTTSAASGLTIAVDPTTGKLVRPTPEQMRALGLAAQPEVSELRRLPPQVVQLPDGSSMLVMDSRFASHAVARVGPGGQVFYDCEHDPAFAAPPAPVPAAARAAAPVPAATPAAAPAPHRYETR